MTKNNKTFMLAMTAMMTAVIACLSWTAIPTPWGIPATLSVFAVAFAGYMAGPFCGTAAVAVYLLLGAAGAPVFAGFSGGIGHFVTPTGGFLFGYLPLAFFTGLEGNGKKTLRSLLCGLAGLAVCHAVGVFVFAAVTGRGVGEAFMLASLPYIIKDGLLVAAATLLSRTVSRRIKGR